MASTVALVGSATLYLHGTATVPWNGSSTPWTSASTTPFEIGNNDVTGERWRLIAPPRFPLQSGSPPFSPWLATQAYQVGNRVLTIPLQLRANSDANLSALKEELVARLFDTVQASLYLQVAWGSKTAIACIENGQFQEDARYWNDEDGRYVMRGLLTLECRIGSDDAYTQLASIATFTNGTANTAALDSDVRGDWRALGQPLNLQLDGGDIGVSGVKTIYAAVIRSNTRSGSLSGSLITSSTSGGSEVGSVTLAASNVRGTRYRLLAHITGGSANLEVRARLHWDGASGQVIYISPWAAPGTSATLVDLGFVNPLLRASGQAMTLYLAAQARSTNGSPTTGTLVYLYIVEYYTWCQVISSSVSANGVFHLKSASPGIASTGPTPGIAFVETASGNVAELCEVRGSLPVAIRGAGLWLAWLDDGAFDPTDLINVEVEGLPLFETIAGS